MARGRSGRAQRAAGDAIDRGIDAAVHALEKVLASDLLRQAGYPSSITPASLRALPLDPEVESAQRLRTLIGNLQACPSYATLIAALVDRHAALARARAAHADEILADLTDDEVRQVLDRTTPEKRLQMLGRWYAESLSDMHMDPHPGGLSEYADWADAATVDQLGLGMGYSLAAQLMMQGRSATALAGAQLRPLAQRMLAEGDTAGLRDLARRTRARLGGRPEPVAPTATALSDEDLLRLGVALDHLGEPAGADEFERDGTAGEPRGFARFVIEADTLTDHDLARELATVTGGDRWAGHPPLPDDYRVTITPAEQFFHTAARALAHPQTLSATWPEGEGRHVRLMVPSDDAAMMIARAMEMEEFAGLHCVVGPVDDEAEVAPICLGMTLAVEVDGVAHSATALFVMSSGEMVPVDPDEARDIVADTMRAKDLGAYADELDIGVAYPDGWVSDAPPLPERLIPGSSPRDALGPLVPCAHAHTTWRDLVSDARLGGEGRRGHGVIDAQGLCCDDCGERNIRVRPLHADRARIIDEQAYLARRAYYDRLRGIEPVHTIIALQERDRVGDHAPDAGPGDDISTALFG